MTNSVSSVTTTNNNTNTSNSSTLVSNYGGNGIRWNVTSLQCVHTLTGHNRGVTALAYSVFKKLIFSGSHDTTIKLWDCSENITPNCVRTLQGHKY